MSYFINFLTALGLVFVIEGILPFMSPEKWRQMMINISKHPDRKLRVMGLSSMLVGLVILVIVHKFLIQ